jgi:hypothetical protein
MNGPVAAALAAEAVVVIAIILGAAIIVNGWAVIVGVGG